MPPSSPARRPLSESQLRKVSMLMDAVTRIARDCLDAQGEPLPVPAGAKQLGLSTLDYRRGAAFILKNRALVQTAAASGDWEPVRRWIAENTPYDWIIRAGYRSLERSVKDDNPRATPPAPTGGAAARAPHSTPANPSRAAHPAAPPAYPAEQQHIQLLLHLQLGAAAMRHLTAAAVEELLRQPVD